jgi:hypothetical protein
MKMVNYNEMKSIKISRCLEATISTLVFRLKRDGIATSYVDRLVVELLRRDDSFASLLVSLLFDGVSKDVVSERIMTMVATDAVVEDDTPECAFRALCDSLHSEVDSSVLSSAHVLHRALRDRTTATHKIFAERGVGAQQLAELMCQLAAGEYNDKNIVG